MSQQDVIDERKADEVFDTLGTYERDQLAVLGTAFTTYEDLGPNVCACLERRARAWRAATMTRAEVEPCARRKRAE